MPKLTMSLLTKLPSEALPEVMEALSTDPAVSIRSRETVFDFATDSELQRTELAVIVIRARRRLRPRAAVQHCTAEIPLLAL